MNTVDRIAKAILYEGYMLYPYRPSSIKNKQRFNFGVLAPRDYCESHLNVERSSFKAECLVRGGLDTALHVSSRFLQLSSRQIGEFLHPAAVISTGEMPEYRLVSSLEVGGQLYQAWQEAVEREFLVHCTLDQLVSAPLQKSFLFLGGEETEILGGAESLIFGLILRRRESIGGEVRLSAERVERDLFKFTMRVTNLSSLANAAAENRDAVLLHSLVSAHATMRVDGGAFVSLLDPPAELQPLAQSCQNTGVWPVLVGREGDHDVMLASPIILYDYPQIAPESPGDLFDGAEIDEILSLRILTMTEEEKREMRQSDERARQILERTESLPEEQFMKLHGVLRGLRSCSGEAP